MRLRRLGLDAFGPFSGVELDLSGGKPGGLHVVYGPNEAGKSTSLRAVTGLLFGIPVRSGDAHLHPLKSLAISATLERPETGEELSFTRKKRKKDSLVDALGQPLADGVLSPWLRGLDQDSFLKRFGLDQDELAEGAQALLAGSEQGLFAAGTAGADARRLIEQLEDRAGQLYKGSRGRNPLLNRALGALAEAQRAARDAVRPPEKWRQQKRAFEQAREREAHLEAERKRLRFELGRLTHLSAVASDVSRWEAARARRAALGKLPVLPVSAPTQRVAALTELREGTLESTRLERELRDLDEELAALPVTGKLLELEEERIAHLDKRIGWELKAQDDLPKLRARLDSAIADVRRRLDDGAELVAEQVLGAAAALAVDGKLVRHLRRLSNEHGRLTMALEQARQREAELRQQLAQCVARLAGLGGAPPPEGLELALAQGRHALRRLERLPELRGDLRRLEQREVRLRSPGVTCGLSELARRSPSVADAERARDELDEVSAQLKELTRQLETQASLLREAEAREQALRAAGEVPSEARLAEARRARDGALGELRRELVEGRSGEPCVRLAETVGRWSGSADQLADGLRLEARRLSDLSRCQQERAVAVAAIEDLERRHAALSERRASLHGVWARRFAELGLVEVSSARFADVARAMVELCEVLERVEVRRAEHAALLSEVAPAVQRLREVEGEVALADASDPGPQGRAPEERWVVELPALVERVAAKATEAHAERERVSRELARRGELQSALDESQAARAAREQELQAWARAWDDALAQLGLAGALSPEDAEATLEERAALARNVEEARQLERRVVGIERDSAEFAAEVRKLVERLAPQWGELAPIDAAPALVSAARDARQAERDRTRLTEDRSLKRQRLAEAQRSVDRARAVLEELQRQAGVERLDELPGVEAQLDEAAQLDEQLRALEDVLRTKAGGDSLEELAAQVRQIPVHELRASIEELTGRLEELDDECRGAHHDVATLERGLELYHSEEAAQAQQQVMDLQAEAREALREYLVVKTAHVLLGREIAQYSQRHQGPILQQAAEYFPRLTLGRYSGLRVGLEERTLRCVRDGREVDVAELSRGTRAQLYLALRLASLQHHFEQHEPLPLVFDDLFVDFDDDRVCATFEILAELAERVQILYFTHLGRDLHAARDAVPPQLLFEHRIGVAGVAPG